MNVGFTGTRGGLTDPQHDKLREILATLAREAGFDTTMHHGDCVGADLAAHHLAYKLGWRIVIHPPSNAKHRAWCNARSVRYAPSTIVLPALPYIERNHRIVDACEVVVACPGTESETLRSGTWATMRYARNQHKRLIVILPSGFTWEAPDAQLDLVNGGGTDEHGGHGDR